MDIADLKLNILKNFKILNSINDNKNDALYKLYIDRSIQEILNLTNRIRFPEELNYVVLDMINDFYDINTNKTKINDESNNYIKSITEENRTVTFGNSSELLLNSAISNHITNNLENRKAQINKFKLLYKEKEKEKNE